MIKEISILAPYCFGNEPLVLSELAPANFIFAANGSGKSTIASALSKQPTNIQERRDWPVAATENIIRVFDETFKNRVLREHVDGIFTIGEESKEVHEQLRKLSQAKVDAQQEIERIKREIGNNSEQGEPSGLLGEIERERKIAEDTIFDQHKQTPQAVLPIIFAGFRNNKSRFLDETLRRYGDPSRATAVETWETLTKKAQSLAGTQERRRRLEPIRQDSLLSDEEVQTLTSSSPIRETGAFAALIRRLSSEDWVSAGRAYIDPAEGKCPFCQQEAPNDLPEKLEEFFAEGYDEAMRRAIQIHSNVDTRASNVRADVGLLRRSAEEDSHLDGDSLKAALVSVETAVEWVISRVATKCQHPTEAVEVTDIALAVKRVNEEVAAANETIDAHNLVIDDASGQKEAVQAAGWSLFIESPAVGSALKRYTRIKEKKTALISEKNNRLTELGDQIADFDDQCVALQDSISNTAHVASRINGLLKSMGFHRFQLTVDDSVAGGYRLLRSNGEPAHGTLSEGERTFIAFAYYWESLFGSTAQGQPPQDVVAVIDDPISSLDSDSLFMVASQIRHACELVTVGDTVLKQLIVLTHNTQFHLEAAYTNRTSSLRDRHYFRLQKRDDGLSHLVDDLSQSAVRGSYNILWESIVGASTEGAESTLAIAGIYNIARRIIESYFKLIGNLGSFKAASGLPWTERRLMDTFEIWANAGSHTIIDDAYQTSDSTDLRRFLQLFQQFFYRTGHQGHFDMMIRSCGGESLLANGGLFAQGS